MTGMAHKFKLSWTVVLVLLVLIIATTAAYAYYRLMSDAGLQGVRDAGLITDLNLTAEATVFSTPPLTSTSSWSNPYGTPAPQATVIAEQIMQGVKVSLDWAYADESRVAIQLTVTGLKPPEGIRPSSMLGMLAVTDDAGNPIDSKMGGVGGGENPDGSVFLTYVCFYYEQMDAGQHPQLDLKADLPIGGFEVPYEAPGMTTDPNQVAQLIAIPLVGNFHFEFSVPVYKGLTITPDRNVEASGITMHLESITLNRSHTDLRLCFQMPSPADWIPYATIQIGEGLEMQNNGFSDAAGKSFRLTNPERCADLSFDVPYSGGATTAVVKVTKLAKSFPEVFSDEQIRTANEKLKPRGIEFEITPYISQGNGGGGGGYSMKILKKPEGMNDDDVYHLINNTLEERIEGPWVFTVEVNP
jgi:hypothetical protein